MFYYYVLSENGLFAIPISWQYIILHISPRLKQKNLQSGVFVHSTEHALSMLMIFPRTVSWRRQSKWGTPLAGIWGKIQKQWWVKKIRSWLADPKMITVLLVKLTHLSYSPTHISHRGSVSESNVSKRVNLVTFFFSPCSQSKTKICILSISNQFSFIYMYYILNLFMTYFPNCNISILTYCLV